MMRNIFIFLFGLLSLNLCAQSSRLISVKIVDAISQKGIQGVHIKQSNKLVISNKSGVASVEVPEKATLQLSHISYRDTTVVINSKLSLVFIQLQPNISNLPTAQVSNEAYAVFSPETTHVFDYEFISDTLLVLTYEKEQMFRKEQDQSEDMFLGCELIVVSPSGNITHTTTLPDYTIGFHRDGLNQLFVKGKNFTKMISLTPYGISFSDVDINVFVSQILPLKNSSELAYYFDDQIWDYPEFTHYSKTIIEGEVSAIRTVRDDFTMELFRAAYKYMSNRDKLKAIRLEYETGIDKEIYGAYMSGFHHSLYYESIYAPMFCLGDTAAIFDHHNHFIYFHNLEGIPIDSVELTYSEKAMGKFDRQLVQDPEGEDIYAVYKKNGRKYLRKVSLINGMAGEKIVLYYPYPEKIKVIGSRVYYIYRKSESRNTKHLYAEHLSE